MTDVEIGWGGTRQLGPASGRCSEQSPARVAEALYALKCDPQQRRDNAYLERVRGSGWRHRVR